MNTLLIRERLFEYIREADTRKIKAIYTILEDEIEENTDIWDDDFVKEMIRRKEEYLDNGMKGYSWEEVWQKAEKQLQSIKK